MAEKRKDSKGRNLLTGESQRKDGTYMYRYTDIFKKRQYIYAATLNELRQKKKQLQKDLEDGLSIKNGNITVSELLDIYLSTNKQWKKSTLIRKRQMVGVIKRYQISTMPINKVRTSVVKEFAIQLHDKGLKTGTIDDYRVILLMAFKKAVEDDWVRKNPCDFKLDFLPEHKVNKFALTIEQEEKLLNVIKEHSELNRYHDIFIVMLETGLRLSEMVGLTLNDIDMKKRVININHQLCLSDTKDDPYSFYIDEFLKTKNAKRDIYISNRAYAALNRMLWYRRVETTVEKEIDGYSKFLMTTKTRSFIVTHRMIDHNIKKAIKLYNETYEDKLPNISAHTFRHTFCTRMIEKGLDLATLQKVMGHAKAETTMDIYTHITKSTVMDNMQRAVDGAM